MLTTAGLASPGLDNGSSVGHRRYHNRALLPMTIIFLAFSYTSIVLRLGTRKRFLKTLGWDDYLIMLAVAFFSIYCGTSLAMFWLADSARGFMDIPPHHINEVASLLVVTECFYILTMIALKLSLAIFFLRVLVISWQRWVIVTTISLTTMFGIITLFFAIFQCGFFSHISVFVVRIVSNQCASEALGLGINYTYASLATISDWTCILVPIFVLKESAMPLKRKLVVGGLMIFASLGSIASIVRLLYLHTITVPTGEFFVNVSKLSIWSTIEPGVGITVASLATLRPLLSKLVKRTYRSTATSPTVAAQTASGGNTLARGPSMKTYTRGGSVGMSSDSTVVASSPVHPKEGEISGFDRWTSKEEKVEDIEAEMRAYGMSNISTHTTLDEDYFNRYSTEIRRSRETERRVHWFESQRAERHPRARDSREHMLRSTSLSQPVSLDLSPVRQRIDENGEECTDEFTLDGQGLPGAPLRNGKADGNEAADA